MKQLFILLVLFSSCVVWSGSIACSDFGGIGNRDTSSTTNVYSKGTAEANSNTNTNAGANININGVELNLQNAIERWSAEESSLGVPEPYQKRIILGKSPTQAQLNSSVMMIHGLYNSPASLMPLTEVFADRNMNILMSRLSGHREADTSILKHSIRWEAWLQQVESDFLLARQLGQKVILVGHSTGALLATWLAAKYPEDVSALILFSPAFGVHFISRVGATFGQFTGINPVKADGKILAGHAGLEVVKAAKAFKAWQSEQGQVNDHGDTNYLAKQLAGIPIWMGNTQSDIVIQKSEAIKFFNLVKLDNPEQTDRVEFWVPLTQLVLHDAITTNSNPLLPEIKNSLKDFLFRIRQ